MNGEFLPLTAAQRGMWFAESMSPNYSVNVAHYLDIVDSERPLDTDLLTRIHDQGARELEAAFTRFIDVDGVPMQTVDYALPFHLESVDLRAERDPLAAAHAFMNDDYRRKVDLLEPGSLARAVLIRIADDRHLWYMRGHHAIMDGYSALNALLRGVDEYNADVNGEPFVEKPRASLTELVRDDSTYATSSRRERDREYWAAHVADLPERVSLAQHAATAPLSPINIMAGRALDDALQDRLSALAAELNVSLAVLLTAGFSAYLSRMTGTDEVVLSVPVTGRATAKIKRASGMVSNMLPVRATGAAELTLRELTAQTQIEMTGVLRHQRYRFEDIRIDAGLRDANTASFGPVVNMVFFDRPIEIVGADVEYQILASGILEDLRVNFYQSSPTAPIVVDLHGNEHLYSRQEIETHLDRFLTFVQRVIAQPDTRLSDVDLLTALDRTTIAEHERGPACSYDGADGNLLDAFEARVAATPNAIALIEGDVEVTYRQFDQRRRALATRVTAAGVNPGDRVIVSLPRGVDQLVAVYATITAGAAYVPVNPTDPQDRRDQVTSTAQATCVIDEAFIAAAAGAPVGIFGTADVPADSIAYVIFTSGSTGTPKGVAVSHRAILNRLAWMQEHYPLTEDDRVLYKTPITFDVSVWELFWPLAIGATTVIARVDGHRDPHYLHREMRDSGVTVAHFVPSMLDVFIESRVSRPAGENLFAESLDRIFTSGEALGGPLAASALVDGTVDLVNLYGPTEAAVDITEYRVTHGETAPTIGKPVPNSQVYVLDDRLHPQPTGAPGELYLAGVQLAQCYVSRSELTAGSFVADPFGSNGSRMYRTGDLVRWTVDGELDYLGRTDFQVKIRGQRVELGEVENVLAAHPAIDIAVAMVREDIAETPTLVGYVRAGAGEVSEPELLAWCRRRLPSHMVPTTIVMMDELPLNASGKLDRKQLPIPALKSAEYVAPESELEGALAGLVAELVGAERVGMRDNLFAIGGDSLVAARLVTRARDGLGLDVQLTDVFESADLAELAAAISSGSNRATVPAIVHVELRPEQIPASLAQSRLWTVNQMDTAAGTYNMPGAVRLPVDIDLDALRLALTDVIERHETLRTTYAQVDDRVIQVIRTTDDALGGIDLNERRDADVTTAVTRFASLGFDLGSETPLRTRLVRAGDELVLVLVVHHIAADGFSLIPLIADLMAAYRARSAGGSPTFTPLELDYADFAMWQSRVLDGSDALIDGLSFWRRELDGLPELIALPTSRPRPHVASGRGGYVDVVADAALVHRVAERAKDVGVTPFSVIHSAFAVVLAQLSGTSDIAIGTAVGGRDDDRLSPLVGMFVDTVVLRSDVRPETTVGDFLTASHRTRARAMAHAVVPFERVVAELAPTRSAAHTPLFQVSLTMLSDTTSALRSGAESFELVDARVPAAKYDLAVSVVDTDDTYEIEFSYATDLFDRTFVQAVAGYLLRVVDQIASGRLDAPIGRIDVLGENELAALAEPRPTAAEPMPLGELWDSHGQAAPGPIVHPDGEWTRAEFDATSNAIARTLIARGIGAGDLVAIGIGRSGYAALAMVAIAKAGAAFVSIDPALPDERRDDILADSGAALGLTVASLRDAAPGTVDWLTVDHSSDAGIDTTPIRKDELVRSVAIDDLAYLIYTSGSTGKPKAAAVSHRGLANMTVNQRTILGLDQSSRVLQVAALSFDASVFEITMALCSGSALVISPADVFAGDDLADLIAAHLVTHVVMTPSAMISLEPESLPTLQTLASVGEACPPELMRRWASAGRRFFNLYGPTESTIWATSAGPLSADDEVTIGTAAPGVHAYVLGDSLRPTPADVPGELYLAGDQIALGYLGRPDLTTSRFVADPFASGARMYRTGDRVTRGPDGVLTYLGRTDFQLKIRGMRIEPGEIDAALATHPGVAAALTVGVPGPAGDPVLISYVTPSNGRLPNGDDVRVHVAGLLPGHMVPHTVLPVAAFVVNNVGKVDRSALPEVDLTSDIAYEEPEPGIEASIAELFASILGVERVGRYDNFFDLGGNSLSATALTGKLSKLTGRHTGVRDLFVAPTVAELAQAVRAAEDEAPSAPLRPRTTTEMVPVSGTQRTMWLLNRGDPESAAYNIAMALEMTGALDIDALRLAFADVVGRHEALRTIYPMVGDEILQNIIDPVAAGKRLELIRSDATGSLAESVAAVTARGFDVQTDLPIRAAVLRTGDHSHVLVLVIHHISGDGSSMAPLAIDMMTAYAARAAGTAPDWAPLPLQYADFALWRAEQLAAVGGNGRTRAEQQLDFWAERLAGAPPVLELPADKTRPKSPSFVGDAVDFKIDAGVMSDLETAAIASGASPFMITRAAFAVLLAKLSGQRDIVIGTPYAGRDVGELDGVVGMFVNTLAMRTRTEPGESFRMVLDRVRRDDLEAMANADVAFDDIVARVAGSTPRSHNAVFQAMFVFQNLTFPHVSLPGLVIEAEEEQLTSAKVDVQLTLFPSDPKAPSTDGAVRGQLIYATDLFERETAEAMVRRYLRVLETIAADPDVIIGDIVVDEASVDAVGDEATAPRNLGDLVAEATDTDAIATAIERDGTVLTFADLTSTMDVLATAMPDSDRDSLLTMTVMSMVPGLAEAGSEALEEVLHALRTNAEAASGGSVTEETVKQ
ncbi:amino acid adenylation domain-containing protein [Gordonia hydrophobica]|uniref:Amino acid adenylation domain-containing protein n=1 Tax=Gordonia hydrophobica TaxID=40516 RepID=A0ABZ2UCB8_9ACTN